MSNPGDRGNDLPNLQDELLALRRQTLKESVAKARAIQGSTIYRREFQDAYWFDTPSDDADVNALVRELRAEAASLTRPDILRIAKESRAAGHGVIGPSMHPSEVVLWTRYLANDDALRESALRANDALLAQSAANKLQSAFKIESEMGTLAPILEDFFQPQDHQTGLVSVTFSGASTARGRGHIEIPPAAQEHLIASETGDGQTAYTLNASSLNMRAVTIRNDSAMYVRPMLAVSIADDTRNFKQHLESQRPYDPDTHPTDLLIELADIQDIDIF